MCPCASYLSRRGWRRQKWIELWGQWRRCGGQAGKKEEGEKQVNDKKNNQDSPWIKKASTSTQTQDKSCLTLSTMSYSCLIKKSTVKTTIFGPCWRLVDGSGDCFIWVSCRQSTVWRWHWRNSKGLCPHACILMLFNMCPHDVMVCVLTRFQMCPHVCHACVLLMLSNMCPHDAMFSACPSHYRTTCPRWDPTQGLKSG